MLQTPLCELAFKYGSDKVQEIKHPYTPFYYYFLKGMDTSIRKVLEIGIGDPEEMAWSRFPAYVTGASLRMWRDFFPKAEIYGMDIKPSCMFTDNRINTFLGNQRSEDDLKMVIGKVGWDVDLVIEDASHRAEDQVFTCRTLMPLLNKNVIYIIEDVSHLEIIDRLPEYICDVPKLGNRKHRDDRLVIVRHKIV
jgi:hypothetical protein